MFLYNPNKTYHVVFDSINFENKKFEVNFKDVFGKDLVYDKDTKEFILYDNEIEVGRKCHYDLLVQKKSNKNRKYKYPIYNYMYMRAISKGIPNVKFYNSVFGADWEIAKLTKDLLKDHEASTISVMSNDSDFIVLTRNI